MTNSEKVIAFLQAHRGAPFCDDCIQRQIGLSDRTGAQLATKTLEHVSGFTRARGRCPSCASTRDKKLTKAK